MNVITKDPTSTDGGYLRLTGGDYALIGTEGAIGGRIGDNVNARISFRTTDHDGYGKNIATGNDIDTQHERAVRIKLEILPTDRLRILLSADYARANDNYGVAWHYLGQAGPATAPSGVLLGGTITTSIRDVANDHDPLRDVKAWGTGATVTYDLGFGQLKSITAYRDTLSKVGVDLDATSFQLFSPFSIIDDGRQFTEETQLTGKTEHIEWMVGLFYFNEKVHATAAAPVYNGLFFPPGYLAEGFFAGSGLKTDAEAAFSQITYHFTDALSATVGARYSSERKSVVDQNSFDVVTPAVLPYTAVFNPAFGTECSQAVQTSAAVCVPSKRWGSFTPKFGIQYQVNQNTLLYASATKGFRSGTYSLGAVQGAPVNPETVWSYETGLKAKFFDNRLTTNLSAFYYKYSDLQVAEVNGTQTLLANAAAARVKGVEAEIVVRPIDPIRLDFSGSYLDARFRQFVSSDPARPAGDGTTLLNGSPAFNLAGNYLPQSPKFSFLAGAEHSLVSGIGHFTLRGEAAYSSRFYYDAFNRPEVSSAPRTRFNASLNYQSPDDRWTASLVGRNLANKVTSTNAFVTTALVGTMILGNIEPPRTIAATLGYRF